MKNVIRTRTLSLYEYLDRYFTSLHINGANSGLHVLSFDMHQRQAAARALRSTKNPNVSGGSVIAVPLRLAGGIGGNAGPATTPSSIPFSVGELGDLAGEAACCAAGQAFLQVRAL